MNKDTRKELKKATKRIKSLVGEIKEKIEHASVESKRKEKSSNLEDGGVEDEDDADNTN